MLNVKKGIFGIISQGVCSSSSTWLQNILRIAQINVAITFCICITERTKNASTTEDVLLSALSPPNFHTVSKQKNSSASCSLKIVGQILYSQALGQ